MAEREPGPYWVRDRFEDEWVDARWTGKDWLLHGDVARYRDADFIEIGPRAVMPPPVIVETTSDDSAPPAVVHYDLNTLEGKRALAAFLQLPPWPEPQPITDAQKTTTPILVWSEGWGEWAAAFWDRDSWHLSCSEDSIADTDTVSHYIPLPPRQWSDEG